ncbi:hypothetical protein EVAR_59978_1 [Eumeta japonica]|uniref:Uncharacterized protein n=1 Tax=Eumeta variegata TaxID=151549 RepID=A0A4C2AA20_EUMVA|nr:hypothetical protein EVAR_59978_1 [Eumeta japonica]
MPLGRREASSSAEVPLPARDCRSGSGRLDRGADGGAIPEIATPLEILKGYRGAGGPVGARPRRDNVTRRRRTRSKSRTNARSSRRGEGDYGSRLRRALASPLIDLTIATANWRDKNRICDNWFAASGGAPATPRVCTRFLLPARCSTRQL